MKKRVFILDTTLRDGAQSEGVSFSIEDKLAVIETLDEFGVSYIEAGNPVSNPKDMAIFERMRDHSLKNARLCAFGSTRHKGILAQEDENLRALIATDAPVCVIVGKSLRGQVEEILKCSPDENLRMIRDSIHYLKAKGREVIFDAEHFFDGYVEDEAYATQCLKEAEKAGADWLVLCDTNGGTFPQQILEITSRIASQYPGKIGIHCHNDCALAVANAVIAVQAGATQVQGTFLGFGERCGNAALTSVIPNLQLKQRYFCIPEERMQTLTDTAHRIAEYTNISVPQYEPYIGRSAFAHKAGMHLDGVYKNTVSFEHIAPETVGNSRKLLLSEISGRSALLPRIHKVAPIARDSREMDAIVSRMKELELEGYQFEAAEASFELVVRKQLGLYRPLFELIGFKTIGEQVENQIRNASAIVHVQVNNQREMTAAQGDGPVHALDCALRKALEVFYPNLKSVHLIDYKVRVLDDKEATAAKVRVLITSTDGVKVWSTVGVSKDIIQASWLALVDSIEYKLICDLEKTSD